MFFIEFLFAMVFSFIVVALFTLAGTRGPWNNLGMVFLVVFLVTWAGGMWITPTGPVLFGREWLPFLIMAGLVALLLVNVVPIRDKKIIESPEEKLEKAEGQEMANIASLGIAFWLFTCLLILTIAIAYLF